MRATVLFQKKFMLFASGVAAALIVPAPASQAAPIAFVANLLGSNEIPATGSLGTGTAIVILDPAANTLHVSVTFSGLSSGTTASHIHCCEATPGANLSVGVATTTPTFAGFPLGVTSGTYDSILDLTLASSYNPAFITSAFDPSHTVAGAEAALISGILNAETYLNVHTSLFSGGEIRGILVAPQLTPLVPASAASNAVAVAHAVDAVFASGSAPAEFVALLNLPAASLPDALERMTAENESAAAQAINESQRQFLALVLDPFAGTRPEQQASSSRGTIWGAVYGGHMRIAGTPATDGRAETSDGGGLAVGYDYSTAPGTVVGAALSIDHRHFGGAQNFGSGRDDGYQFALYGKTDVDAFYFAADGAYAIYDMLTARTVSVTGAAGNYNARYTGHGFGGRFEGGMHFPVADFDATPFAAVVADNISMPPYSERTQSGSSILAMQSAQQSFDRIRSELGVGWNTTLEGADEPLLLHGRVGWAHEFANADSIPFAFKAFPNQTFTVAGLKLRDTAFVNAGLMLQIATSVTLGGSFEGSFGSSTSYGGSAQMRVAL